MDISRQAAIDAVGGCTNCRTEDELRAYVTKHYLDNGWTGGIVDALDAIEQLSPAQPEPAIPLQWIEAQIEWLKSLDNAFSTLTAVQISVMVNKWKGEQDER